MKIAKDCVVTLAYQLVDQKNFVLDDGKEPLVYLHGGYNDLFEKVEKALEGKEITPEHVVLDGNHPCAGINLVFRATIKEVRLATPEEITECYAR